MEGPIYDGCQAILTKLTIENLDRLGAAGDIPQTKQIEKFVPVLFGN